MNDTLSVDAILRLLTDRIKWYREGIKNIENGKCDFSDFNFPMMDGISGPSSKMPIPNDQAYKSCCKQSAKELELAVALIKLTLIEGRSTP